MSFLPLRWDAFRFSHAQPTPYHSPMRLLPLPIPPHTPPHRRLPPSSSTSSSSNGTNNFFTKNNIVYTFLATLILLLGVSSAIVVRSLLLRRRHRRMVAEAIANGTWIPPAPRVKVDLRKKPRLWDVWITPPSSSAADTHTEQQNALPKAGAEGAAAEGSERRSCEKERVVPGEGDGDGEEGEWDVIMDFPDLAREFSQAEAGRDDESSLVGVFFVSLPGLAVVVSALHEIVISVSVCCVLPFAASYSPPPTLRASPAASAALLPPPASPIRNIIPSSTTNLSTAPPSQAGTDPTLPFIEQPRVRVAVLVVMPSPGMFGPNGAPSSSASSPQPQPQTPPRPTAHTHGWAPYLPPLAPGDDPEGVGLPYLEVGVASVGVVSVEEGEDDGAAAESGGGEDKREEAKR
ncbi:hypothetical protein R3P38DRAFT_3239625 [Favolaschia claudopus]|uniref:Uncharacterized protein n=1 Tax=Favolaschia claudopus TaxID=2862362 RepID=A0AAV9Z7I9_9AGAR